jgi:hypothetical protein
LLELAEIVVLIIPKPGIIDTNKTAILIIPKPGIINTE